MATVSECKSQQDAPAKVDHNFLSKPTSHLRRPIKSLPIVVSEESGLCTHGYVCVAGQMITFYHHLLRNILTQVQSRPFLLAVGGDQFMFFQLRFA